MSLFKKKKDAAELAKSLEKLMTQAYHWGEQNNWPVFEAYPQWKQIREIGKKLNKMGGYNAMQEALSLIDNKDYTDMLDRFFDGIGDWMC